MQCLRCVIGPRNSSRGNARPVALVDRRLREDKEMALSRCLERHANPKGRANEYVGHVKSTGYPDTAIVCGLCDRPGVMWLTVEESEAYENGRRIFQGPNLFTQMRAGEGGVVLLAEHS